MSWWRKTLHSIGEKKQEKTFQRIKFLLTNTPILALPYFDLECDAPRLSIGVVLLQSRHPIAYFSEKLHSVILNYPTYDKKLYALVMTFKLGNIILCPKIHYS